ncbi:hypothetical protein DFH09DRAFT_1140725 [Mycena vulgaris]|nr:hypothetical protein DFH09DRAFT_1140725 [Mycena vulgaris]
MQKAKGPRTKSSNRDKKRPGQPSYNVLDVPPELWAFIASFASRQSVARLCCVSQRFYSTFSALLYENLVISASNSLFIRTLGDAQASGWKPHPATLIKQLQMTGYYSPESG